MCYSIGGCNAGIGDCDGSVVPGCGANDLGDCDSTSANV